MAVIHPGGWRALAALGGAQREIETLALLERQLPDSHVVYHGVHWTRLQSGHAVHGEIDFVVVAPNGRVLLIEQKSGFLEETAQGLFKHYRQEKKHVATQMARTVENLQARYAQGHGGQRLVMDVLLYCPDYTVTRPHVAGLDPGQIVDASRRGALATVIVGVLAAGEADARRQALACRFFEGVLELVPEIGAVSESARTLYSRLSGGLAEWARRLDVTPFRLRVTGTAGSGKTQLALAALRDAAAAGRRALYVCFNRPLADHLAQLAPEGAAVRSFHQLCDQVLRSTGYTPDFAAPGAFTDLAQRFAATAPGEPWRYDEIIIDEGQDFEQAWVEPLLRLLRPGGRAWWLEDPLQNLYGREPVALPGWVTLRSDTNYRTPRDILEQINALVQPTARIEAGSPLSGAGLEVVSYRDTAQLVEETKLAITRCLRYGFRRDLVAVLTYRGRESSAVMPFDELGPYRLRKFTGRYDLFGTPLYSDGDVTLETVFRFKGQSAPAVVLTEVDFETLDDNALRRLFVGATRATMKLILIVSERAARVCLQRLRPDER